jgi:hypothetical protein
MIVLKEWVWRYPLIASMSSSQSFILAPFLRKMFFQEFMLAGWGEEFSVSI